MSVTSTSTTLNVPVASSAANGYRSVTATSADAGILPKGKAFRVK